MSSGLGIITGAAGGVGTAWAERFAAGGLVAHSCRRAAGRR
jgi:NAD(P)-dependent dehydrogenase (short-subunit alcohol dehydrogenase family)